MFNMDYVGIKLQTAIDEILDLTFNKRELREEVRLVEAISMMPLRFCVTSSRGEVNIYTDPLNSLTLRLIINSPNYKYKDVQPIKDIKYYHTFLVPDGTDEKVIEYSFSDCNIETECDQLTLREMAIQIIESSTNYHEDLETFANLCKGLRTILPSIKNSLPGLITDTETSRFNVEFVSYDSFELSYLNGEYHDIDSLTTVIVNIVPWSNAFLFHSEDCKLLTAIRTLDSSVPLEEGGLQANELEDLTSFIVSKLTTID